MDAFSFQDHYYPCHTTILFLGDCYCLQDFLNGFRFILKAMLENIKKLAAN